MRVRLPGSVDGALRATIIVVLVVDAWVGWAFTTATAAQTGSGAYDPAKRVANMLPETWRVPAFGLLLLALAAAAALLIHWPRWSGLVMTLLIGYWLFWVVAFGAAFLVNGHGQIVGALAVTQTWCHFMAVRRLNAVPS